MSQQLINLSADLKRLRDDGYDIEIVSSYLLIKQIPYVNSKREVRLGILVSELTLAGDITTKPRDHVVMFIGEHPCQHDGSEMAKIKHTSADKDLGNGIIVNHSFSSKPADGYTDYYEKMNTYATIISSQAQALDPLVTPRPHQVTESYEDDSVFEYLDTSSGRADIVSIANKMAGNKIGIIGLGGTGSYILDLIAKTPVQEIHLFDSDKFLQHNAFRSPGSASLEELRTVPFKVDYFKARYSLLHKNIVAHNCFVREDNVESLRNLTFVFICIDSSSDKRTIIQKLLEYKIPFIDVGMGIERRGDELLGILRTTTCTTSKHDHITSGRRIPMESAIDNDEYSKNIQIADLNALNAALAVIKWKKLQGFYMDLEKEHHSTYTIDGDLIINDEQCE